MIFCHHTPDFPLARFVEFFWFYEDFYPSHSLEHVLPDGTFELVIDLREVPRKLFDRDNSQRYASFRRGWVSGAHSKYLVIDALPASSMIGAHFKPGGAAAFLGLPADALHDQVVGIEAIWGRAARDLRERLLSARLPREKFRFLEEFLLELLGRAKSETSRQDGIFWALSHFVTEPQGQTIRGAAEAIGISHKHFVDQFRKQVGITPKLFCRIHRFQQVLSKVNSGSSIEWADVACGCGYFDQAHFIHDFKAFAGLNPSSFLVHNRKDPKFLPIDG